jgi:hypothetical protein
MSTWLDSRLCEKEIMMKGFVFVTTEEMAKVFGMAETVVAVVV